MFVCCREPTYACKEVVLSWMTASPQGVQHSNQELQDCLMQVVLAYQLLHMALGVAKRSEDGIKLRMIRSVREAAPL